MKLRWISFCLVLYAATAVFAQNSVHYIFNDSKVMVRKSPGTKNKIVAMLDVSTPVTVLEKGKNWTRVQTNQGVEGFILSRFLTLDVPAEVVLADLQETHEALKRQTSEPMQEIEKLTTENRRLTQAAAEQTAAYEALKEQYKTLSHRSQNVLELQQDYDAVKKQLTEAVSRADALTIERDNLKLSQRIRWFLSGAGVLLLGLIIGYSAKKKRGRTSSLY